MNIEQYPSSYTTSNSSYSTTWRYDGTGLSSNQSWAITMDYLAPDFFAFFNALNVIDAIMVHRKIFNGDSDEIIARYFGLTSNMVRKRFRYLIERAELGGVCEYHSRIRCFNREPVGFAHSSVLGFPDVAGVTRENCLEKLSTLVRSDMEPWDILFSHHDVCFVSMLVPRDMSDVK